MTDHSLCSQRQARWHHTGAVLDMCSDGLIDAIYSAIYSASIRGRDL